MVGEDVSDEHRQSGRDRSMAAKPTCWSQNRRAVASWP